jgi:hypothetical protein
MKVLSTLTVLVVCTAALEAQCLVGYSSAAPMGYVRAGAQSPVAPAGGIFNVLPTTMMLPPMPFPAGGAAVDQVRHRFYYTNGTQLVCMPLPETDLVPGPFGPVMWPAFFGPLTGLACNDTTGSLWMTDGWSVMEYDTIGGVILNLFTGPFAGSALRFTGLEYDQGANEVLALVQDSRVIRFTPTGVILGILLPSFGPPGLATGLAQDSSAPSKPLYISYNNVAVRMNTGAFFPLLNPFTQGLACVALPATLPQGAVCTPMPLDAWVNSPEYTNNMGWQLTLSGGPSASIVLLGIDVSYLPLPIVLLSGSNLWLNPASTSLLLFTLPTSLTGDAALPIPLTLPPGFLAYAQWLAICPMNGLAYCSELLQVRISEP